MTSSPPSDGSKRVLVTGGTGFVGRNLIPHLLEAGHHVTLLVREKDGDGGRMLPRPLGAMRSRLALVYADLRHVRPTRQAVADAAPDVIIHLAAAGVNDPFLPLNTALRHNLDGTLNLLRAAFAPGTPGPRIIVGRTSGEHGCINVYAASKAAAWSFCRMFARTENRPIVGAMIYQAYGPYQSEKALIPSAARAALAGENFRLTTGTQARDWVFVGDVVEGIGRMVSASIPPSTTLDLATGELTTVAQVVRQVYSLADRGGEPLIGALPSRPGEPIQQLSNVEPTRRMLEWFPGTALRDGLKTTLSSLRVKS